MFPVIKQVVADLGCDLTYFIFEKCDFTQNIILLIFSIIKHVKMVLASQALEQVVSGLSCRLPTRLSAPKAPLT